MEMINKCLDITDAKRAALDQYDAERRHIERKAMIEERRARRGEYSNRKERRAAAARLRKLAHV